MSCPSSVFPTEHSIVWWLVTLSDGLGLLSSRIGSLHTLSNVSLHTRFHKAYSVFEIVVYNE